MDYVPNNFKSLSDLFDCTLTDLKSSIALWDDLVIKVTRLHAALRGVVQANSGFLESFQRIADLATNSSGIISKDIGASMTRLSLRQRSLHLKLKAMNENMACKIIDPMQQRLDEWKRCNLQLDKDRIKETRRAKNDLKRATDEKNRVQRKAIKRGSMKGLGPLQMQVEVALKEAADKYQALENIEYDCVRRVLTEERSRFCYFVSCLMSVLDCQINMFSELTGLEELKENINSLIENPHCLTAAAEDLIKSIMRPSTISSLDAVVAASLAYSATPPASTDTGSSEESLISSRKSSVLSINSEASSSHSGGMNNALTHRRSRSESPTNVLEEQEADDVLMSENVSEEKETDTFYQRHSDFNDHASHIMGNGDISTYDSVTLKRPRGGKCDKLSEEDLVMLSSLPWQPETPNVNAQYSALYQLSHPVGVPGYGRKLSSSAVRNGELYPEYNTIHSSSPSNKPRRMTVPELPQGSMHPSSYTTIRQYSRINPTNTQSPGNTIVMTMDQIEECQLPPIPNDLMGSNGGGVGGGGGCDSHSTNTDADETDLPLPPPPALDQQDTRSSVPPTTATYSVVVSKQQLQPPSPAPSVPPPPPPPCAPPQTCQVFRLQQTNVPASSVLVPPPSAPAPPAPPPPPPPPPVPSAFILRQPK